MSYGSLLLSLLTLNNRICNVITWSLFTHRMSVVLKMLCAEERCSHLELSFSLIISKLLICCRTCIYNNQVRIHLRRSIDARDDIVIFSADLFILIIYYINTVDSPIPQMNPNSRDNRERESPVSASGSLSPTPQYKSPPPQQGPSMPQKTGPSPFDEIMMLRFTYGEDESEKDPAMSHGFIVRGDDELLNSTLFVTGMPSNIPPAYLRHVFRSAGRVTKVWWWW